MSFMPQISSRLVPGVGKPTSKIAIVGDFTTPFDDKELRPFVGPNGTVLETCLHAAGLIRGEVYLTNIFKSKSMLAGKHAGEDFFTKKGAKRSFTAKGDEHARMLITELNAISPNVIVAMGDPAFKALTQFDSTAKYRGYVCASNSLNVVRKVIPTHSPTFSVRGNYINRHLIVMDLRKAKTESEFPELIRPARTLIYDYSSVEEALQWLDYLYEQPEITFDIEVINYEVSCISFSPRPDLGIVIPFGHSDYRSHGWEELDELQLWRGVQRVLGNPETTKVVQNGSFDIHFLLTRCGVEVRGPIRDTMIGHSVMYPELPKGLDFLGSVYCGAQEYWKDSVKFDNIKGES